jgi:oxygen-independent coproporphyrinogen-3 oxidase
MERDLRADLSAGARPALTAAEGARRFVAGPPPLGLYAHLPWCLRKCPYCDFNSHAHPGPLPQQAYVAALLANLDAQLAAGGGGRPVVSVFVGGGTPSLLGGPAIRDLIAGVRSACDLTADAEITLEANPGVADAGRFEAYLRAGVNRLSIGVQSLSAAHLQALGRIHDPAQALAAYAAARDGGFENINLDLMFGLPGQTRRQAREDLSRLVELGAEHVSYYQLTLEPNTAFARVPPPLPDEEVVCDMQEDGVALLASAGYVRYEVSGFARSGRQCRHNRNYWRFGDYLGIGAGAHGKLTDGASGLVERRTQRRHPDAFVAEARRIGHRRRLTDSDLVVEFALNALRLVGGVEASLFERRTGLSSSRIAAVLDQARAEGLLTTDRRRIAASPLGFRFLNDLVARFAP